MKPNNLNSALCELCAFFVHLVVNLSIFFNHKVSKDFTKIAKFFCLTFMKINRLYNVSC